MEMEAPAQGLILKDLGDQAISEIVEKLDSDDAADVVGDLPPEQAQKVIGTVSEEVSEEIEKLLPYPEDTAGGIMGLEFVAVPVNATLKDAIESIRSKRKEVENVYYVWAVDEKGRLAGVISLKDLLLEPAYRTVREILELLK